jgi:hypothetical protein
MLLESSLQGALRLDQEILALDRRRTPMAQRTMPEQGPDFLAAFHSAVTGCADDRPTFEDGVKNNEIIDAIFHSARSRPGLSSFRAGDLMTRMLKDSSRHAPALGPRTR